MTKTVRRGQAALDRLCTNTTPTLSIDAVQRANSGHPGTPMDAAPTVYCLGQGFLRYDPGDPNWLFESQAYRHRVLPSDVSARVEVAETSTFGWERYTGPRGVILGMHTFGLSAPLKVVQQRFGFTPEHVVAAAREQIGRYHEIDREGSGK